MSTNFSEEGLIPDDWISQAEAARLRGVSRQAIAKLVRRGRLRAVRIGGHLLVKRIDVEHFTPQQAGRPRKNELSEEDG